MNLSKSKYCNAIQCKKMLWMSENKPEEGIETTKQSVLANGNDVGNLAKELFGKHINIEFSDNLSEMIKDTNKTLQNETAVITEASFNYNNNFCSVDILKKDKDNYEIYEVKSSTSINDIYLDDITYQYYILKSLGYNVNKCSIVYLNKDYIRQGPLDLNDLFIIEDVTEIVLNKSKEVNKTIASINAYMVQKEEPNDDIGMHCIKPYECPFFAHCTKELEKPNVFDIQGMHNSQKFKLYHEGKYKFEDLLNEKINQKYKEQIDYELNNKEDKVEIEPIKEFLKTLTFPLYFLDFETFQDAIPKYDNVSPYEQIPFQYSLHYYENINGQLKHDEFLANGINDPRRELAESLVKNIPKDACVLAYNMSFEKSVIKKLAYIFPDLSEHLLNIYSNIKDLMIPFQKRYYYNKLMKGSYSIKYVLPALFPNDPELDYHNLEGIHNGSEAMEGYHELSKLNGEDKEHLRENMLKYCSLDTYAMVRVRNYLDNLK